MNKSNSYGTIQWKGTDVCMDAVCKCGQTNHIDGEFMYYIKCTKCNQVYMVNPHIEFIEIDHEPKDRIIFEI